MGLAATAAAFLLLVLLATLRTESGKYVLFDSVYSQLRSQDLMTPQAIFLLQWATV
jgi:hypothetical protein